MKVNKLLVLFSLFLFFAFSCATTDDVPAEQAPFDQASADQLAAEQVPIDQLPPGQISVGQVSAQESLPTEAPQMIIIEDPDTELAIELSEPLFLLPEIHVLMPEPDESLLGLLPEPSLPEIFFQDLSELEPIPEDIPVIAQPELIEQAPIFIEPPQPPPFLRPPEQETPITPREQITLPIEPLPEQPARILASPSEEVIAFSRIVRATVGQLVEIPFYGTGWVFLGEIGARRGITFDSRRLDDEGQSFIFRTETPGTYILRFYRQDFIRDFVINDHVQVIISEAPDTSGTGLFSPPIDRGRVIAEPRWPPLDQPPQASSPAIAVPPSAAIPAAPPVETQPQAVPPALPPGALPPPAASTDVFEGGIFDYIFPDEGFTDLPEYIVEDPSPSVISISPEELLNLARAEFNSGRIESSLSYMDVLVTEYPSSLSDEALWLLGQLYEANSPLRDIRLSLEYYQRLIREYPQSPLVLDAQRRISFIERFYFNIR